MAPAPREIRVVVVSPGDVARERDVLEHVVDGLNRYLAATLNLHLRLWRWEKDARSGLHLLGPQGLIDELMDVRNADLVVGIFWTRFGTPTVDAESGTEHELRQAWEAWSRRKRPDVMVYFCMKPRMPESQDELDQFARVLAFRKALPEAQLWWRYRTVKDFEDITRDHLSAFLIRYSPANASIHG